MAKTARPAASRTRTRREIRSTPGWKRKVTTPATQAAAISRQSLRADRGHDADEHVAEHPAAQRGRAGQDEDAEQVEPLLHRDQAAGQREDEHPDEVEDELQLGVLDEHRGGQNYRAAWPVSRWPVEMAESARWATREMAMHDLRLIGVHEDGEHLLLSDSEGGRFRVRVDEPLRTAVRRDRPRLGQQQIEIDGGFVPATSRR